MATSEDPYAELLRRSALYAEKRGVELTTVSKWLFGRTSVLLNLRDGKSDMLDRTRRRGLRKLSALEGELDAKAGGEAA